MLVSNCCSRCESATESHDDSVHYPSRKSSCRCEATDQRRTAKCLEAKQQTAPPPTPTYGSTDPVSSVIVVSIGDDLTAEDALDVLTDTVVGEQQANEIGAIVDEVQSDAEATIEQIEVVDEQTDAAAATITDTVDDLDEIADSVVETSESVDEVADTTQTFADDMNDIASKVIDAISQGNDLREIVENADR